MRRKAKELQQARRDAERSGKKVPAFGGFGSAGMTSVSSGSIITDTIVEPEKPKITPAAVRYGLPTAPQPLRTSPCASLIRTVPLWFYHNVIGFLPDQADPARP